jgi:plastocyanin
MKKVIVVLVVLFIGILFAGCTSQPSTPVATPTPTPVPTTVATPVPTAIPTPVVTPNMTANVTANVTALPTPVPTPAPVEMITFTQTLSVTPAGTLYVPVGTTVAWFNNDPYKPHGIQSAGSTNNAQNFGTVMIPYGKMYNVTFSQKGAYNYVTVFQPSSVWKIVVS